MSMIPAEHVGRQVWLVCAQKDARLGLRWEPRCVTIVRDAGGLHLLPAWGRIGDPGAPVQDLFPLDDWRGALLRANELNLADVYEEQDEVAAELDRLTRERGELVAKGRE